MPEDPHMPKWALDPLLSESTPLQAAGGAGEGHGAVSGSAADEADSDGDYDSEFSDEDVGRVRGRLLHWLRVRDVGPNRSHSAT